MLHKTRGRWRTAAYILISALTLGCVAGASVAATVDGPVPPVEQHKVVQTVQGSGKKSAAVPKSDSGKMPVSIPSGDSGEKKTEQGPAAPAQEGQQVQPEGKGYDFTQPAPQSEAVDNSYFEDAAFVGDSRTNGFLLYSGIGRGESLTSNGLSIFQLAEKKALTIEGEKYTLLEALALKQYGKVYLSLGVNELGYRDDPGFYRSYCESVDTIRALQPNAVIYIQGLIPVNEEVIAQTTGRTYLTNEHLRVYNDLMRQTAQEKNVVFLDLYSEFVDENGSLPAEASKDGVHLRKAWCQQWLTYLQTHTVPFEELYPDGISRVQTQPAGEEGTEAS